MLICKEHFTLSITRYGKFPILNDTPVCCYDQSITCSTHTEIYLIMHWRIEGGGQGVLAPTPPPPPKIG